MCSKIGINKILVAMCLFFTNYTKVYGQTDTILSKKYYELGIVSYNNGEFRQALNYYDTAIFYDPINLLAIMNKGIAYNDLKVNDTAILLFSKLIDIASKLEYIQDYSLAYYLRGNSYYNLKKYEQALSDIDLYFKKKTSDENDVQVNSLQGQCLYFLDKEDSAIVCLNKALATDPNNFTANLYLGRCYSKINKEKARAYFTKAVEVDNKNFDAYKYWGTLENESENYADAKALLEIAQGLSIVDDAYLFVNLAIAQAGSGEIEASLINFKKAEANPEIKAKIPFKRMELYAASSDRLDETAQKVLLDDITYLATQYTIPIQKAQLIFLKVYLKAAWQYPAIQIIPDIDEAIKLHPTEWKFYFYKAYFSQNKLNKHKESIAAINTAIKLKNIWKLYYFKAILYNDLGLKKEACACVKKAQLLPNEKKITNKMATDICKGKKITTNLDLEINHIIENGMLF